MPQVETILDAKVMGGILDRLGSEILTQHPKAETLGLVGLPRRGAFLAKRLAARIQKASGTAVPVGQIDITFHRDDLETRLPIPHITEIPFDVDGRTLILVDDVLFTGRSVRAALTALADFGRPAAVRLATLIDRGHRQLPIAPDFTGQKIETKFADEVIVKVSEVDGADAVEVARA